MCYKCGFCFYICVLFLLFLDPDNTEFSRSSTPEEWFMKGMSFFERKHFEIAIKCFQKSGYKKEEDVATGFLYIQQAHIQDSAAKKQKHFLIASKYFFNCNMCIRSAWCLSEAHKYELSARLYQKCHKACILTFVSSPPPHTHIGSFN